MAHSDSDDFHSADEQTHDSSRRNESGKKNKDRKAGSVEPTGQSENDGRGDDWDDFEVGDSISAKTKKIEPSRSTKTNEGWDDFKIDDAFAERDDDSSSAKTKKIESNKSAKTNDGWDEFDNWDDDEKANNKSVLKLQEHSETEYKQLADRLSSLDANGGANSNANSGWGGWSGWGVTNLLTSGVTQITSHVSQGFASVSQVLETGIGVPDPEELAKSQKNAQVIDNHSKEITNTEPTVDKEIDEKHKSQNENVNIFKLGNLVSSVTKLVETTGQAVVTGGLDTLEEIGKRTMRVLQGEEEGKKRLSTLLKEARERAEQPTSENVNNENQIKKKCPQFEAMFDDFQGLVHLEALEMLSKQCDIKIQYLLSTHEGRELNELKETLEQVKEICELPDPDEDDNKESDSILTADKFREKLLKSVEDMGVQLHFDPIVECCKNIVIDLESNLFEDNDTNEIEKNTLNIAEDILHKAIINLAQISALSVQLLHRSTALLSVQTRRSTADEADGLTQLTTILISHINEIANLYSHKLNKIPHDYDNTEKINEFITTVFLEAGKGSSFIHDAFSLTIPILQVGAT